MDSTTIEQLNAINDPCPFSSVVAAAGSGKTMVLIERFLRFVHNFDVEPARIAIITFTNEAAREIEVRLGKISSRDEMPGFTGTIHGFGLKLLRDHGLSIGFPGGLSVVDEKTSNTILTRCMVNLGLKCSFSEARKIVSGKETDSPKERALFQLFHATLATNGLVDFDGILFTTKRLLEKREGATSFLGLLVDEFQDISQIDHDIIQLMKLDVRFVVGDPRQAIFGFRGGDPKFLSESQDMARWKTSNLTLNFRSAQEIVRAANRLASHFHEVLPPMRSVSEEDGTVEHFDAPDPAGQISAIVAFLSARSGRRVVLCRYNRHISEIQRGLKAAGIETVAKQLRERPRGWDAARALVAFMSNPNSEMLAMTLVTLTEGPKRADAMEETSRTTGTSMRRLMCMDEDVEFDQLSLVMDQCKIPEDTRVLIDQIVSSLPENERTWTGLAAALAAPAVLEADVSVSDDRVILSTIHSFKGREADHVVIAYANEEFIPASKTNGRRIAEERRLFYVAMTRARASLLVVSTRISVGFSGETVMIKTNPSRFIGEAVV